MFAQHPLCHFFSFKCCKSNLCILKRKYERSGCWANVPFSQLRSFEQDETQLLFSLIAMSKFNPNDGFI